MAGRRRETPEQVPIRPTIEMGNNITRGTYTLFLQAVYEDDCQKIADLIREQGVTSVRLHNEPGVRNNLVCVAAMAGRTEILTMLLENDEEGLVDLPDNTDYMWQRRPIHMAASHGHVACIDILLNKGVEVNSRDSDHRTPLHWASTYGHKEMVEFLISKGASVNIAQVDGFTALHAATCLGHTEVCRTLIQHGAHINRADRDNWTALHTAACYGHLDVARIIVDAGASLHQRNSDEETAFHIACSSGHVEIAEMLFNHGAQINTVNMKGYTPFFHAVYYNKFDVVRFLVTVNADMDTVNTHGQTPLSLAAIRGQEKTVQLMVQAGCKVSGQYLSHLLSMQLTQKDIIELFQYLAANPCPLKDLCCQTIRSLLKHTLVDDVLLLPIPQSLKDLIMLKHLK